MSKTSTLSGCIWLVEVNPLGVRGIYTLFPKELCGGIKRVSLALALKSLDKSIKPPFILLEGQPGRTVQNAMSQINEHAPSLPVFVISQWQSTSEMRSWLSRYFTELA